MKRIFIVLSLVILMLTVVSCQTASQKISEKPTKSGGSEMSPRASQVLERLQKQNAEIQHAIKNGDVFYLQLSPVFGTYFKSFGEQDIHPFSSSTDMIAHYSIFSKDHKKLYIKFMDIDKGQTHLFTIPAGGSPEYIFTYNGRFDYYDVSPNGKEIVFGIPGKPFPQIMRYSVGTRKLSQITDSQTGGLFPTYSPDGQYIAYCSHKKLRIKNTQTDKEEIIVDNTLTKELPNWSPDGKWITYQATPEIGKAYNIFKINLATKEIVQLTDNQDQNVDPSFDRTGKHIVYVSSSGNKIQQTKIWIMDTDGNNKRIDPSSPEYVYLPAI